MIAHIAGQPLLWESEDIMEELKQNVASLANEYQRECGDTYFMENLDKFHGDGLAVIAAVLLWKGHSFFNIKKNAQKITAIRNSGESKWRDQLAKAVREWRRQVHDVVSDYLDALEKRKRQREFRLEKKEICTLRSESEWRELEANTLRNLMVTAAFPLKQSSERLLRRRELSLRLHKECSQEHLKRALSEPVPQGSSERSGDLMRTSSSVVVSDIVEEIQPDMETPMEAKRW
jgi:lambda repressor-like predicted transcriptional regulator